jgi:hypothetical protein
VSGYLLKSAEAQFQIFEWLESSMVNYASEAPHAYADEDSLCETLFRCLGRQPVKTDGGSLQFIGHKVRGRGPAAPEKKLGADGLWIVDIETPEASLHGFLLYQAKKTPSRSCSLGARSQCDLMLSHTAASVLWALSPSDVRVAGAMAVAACKGTACSLDHIPNTSFLKFVLLQMLRGHMLAPISAISSLQPLLSSELRYALSLIGGSEDRVQMAVSRVRGQLSELGLELESIDH